MALIRGGRLHRIGADASYQFSEGDQFGIVSDTYVKWRGGKIPTREEESQVLVSVNRAKCVKWKAELSTQIQQKLVYGVGLSALCST